MKAVTMMRYTGLAQLVFGGILFATIAWTYSGYQSSLADLSRFLATSILAGSNVINKVAETIRIRQDLLDEATRTIKAGQKMIKEAEEMANRQGPLLQQYASSAASASAVSARLSHTLPVIGGRLASLSVPKSIHMNGYKPELVWAKPYEDLGKELTASGPELKNLSIGLKHISETMNTDAPKMNAAFINAAHQTSVLLNVISTTLGNIKTEELPKAVKELDEASRQLRSAGDQISGIEVASQVLLTVGLISAILFCLNGMCLLLYLKSIEQP